MSGNSLDTPPTHFKELITSVNDTEIRKQLSNVGRNKECEPDDLPIESIMVVAELKPELLIIGK